MFSTFFPAPFTSASSTIHAPQESSEVKSTSTPSLTAPTDLFEAFFKLPNEAENEETETRLKFFKKNAGFFTKINIVSALIQLPLDKMLDALDAYFPCANKVAPKVTLADVIIVFQPGLRLKVLKMYQDFVGDCHALVSLLNQEDRLKACEILATYINEKVFLKIMRLLTPHQAYTFIIPRLEIMEHAESFFKVLRYIPIIKILNILKMNLNTVRNDPDFEERLMLLLESIPNDNAEKQAIADYVLSRRKPSTSVASSMASISSTLASAMTNLKTKLKGSPSTSSAVVINTPIVVLPAETQDIPKSTKSASSSFSSIYTEEVAPLVTEIDGVDVDPLAQKPVALKK